MNAWEDALPILEVDKSNEPSPFDDVGEVRLGGVIGGDTGRYDETGAAVAGADALDSFGKEGIGVQFSDCRECESS